MAGTIYNRLFNIKVLHDFYVSGISKKDLAFAPTGSTALAMKNTGMLYRNDEEGGFRVLYKVDAAGNPFIDFGTLRLVFAMQLVNVTEFLNFTKLTDYTAGKILYFTNKGAVTTSDIDFILLDYLRPALFSYVFPQSTGVTGHISITNEDGVEVTPTYPDPNTITGDENNRFSYPIDFSKLPKGLYTFETWTNIGGSDATQTVYIDTELAAQNVFGIVDIIAGDANADYPGTPGTPPSDDYRLYNLLFARNRSTWKYILVLKSPGANTSPLPALTIEDDGSPVQPVYGTLVFNPADDTTVNGLPAKIITSTTMVPFFETPKKGLTIMKDGLDVFMSNLPSPAINVISSQTKPTVDKSITEIFVII